MAGKDLGVHAAANWRRLGLLQGLEFGVLGSEEMLLEMSGDKFTWVGL